jgi:serine/threonine protein kinase
MAAAHPPLAPPVILQTPSLTDHYDIGARRISLGGFKRVFKARHRISAADCILGLLTHEAYDAPHKVADAHREVAMHQHINSLGCPKLIRLLAAHEFPSRHGGRRLAVSVELADGGDLLESIIKRRNYTENDARCIFRDLQEALAALHRADM